MSSNTQEDTSKSVIHHKNSHNFKQNFVNDVKVLRKGIAMNPFVENKLKRVNNSKIHFPEKSVDIVRESRNKNELNEYLAKKLIELHKGPQLSVATLNDSVFCSFNSEPLHHSDISITKCQSEEADQR